MNHVLRKSLRFMAPVGASAALILSAGAMSAEATQHHHAHSRGATHGAMTVHKTVFTSSKKLTNPDDITVLGGRIYVVWQNATQADGSGPGTSTVVAYRNNGRPADRWQIPGHVDGLTADPANHRLIVTANEDANSALYTITPHGHRGGQVRRYTYAPDPSTLTGGGTDAVSIVAGKILISASNPQNSTSPAVFQALVPENGTVATLTPYFYDDSTATDATTGQPVMLHLTDPDSNARVPRTASNYAGQFMLDSQGDSELIFAADRGAMTPTLTMLGLTAGSGMANPQVDDVRWTTSPYGTLYAVDGKAGKVYAITGHFGKGTALTAIPSDSPSLADDIGVIDLATGKVTPIVTGLSSPKGLLYLPGHVS